MSKKQHKAGTQSSWPVAYRLAALGTLLIYTAAGTAQVHIAQAQSIPATTQTQTSSLESPPLRQFHIAPGPLDEVLAGFQASTGIGAEFATPALTAIQSAGIEGRLTPADALSRALKGTGVTHRFVAPNRVRLELERLSTSVDISARPELASPKYTEPLVNTPQTVTVIPQNLIEKQGATTLRDVLRNVPGLTITAGEGGAPAGDNLTLRGFSARNDVFVDGVRDLGPQSRDPFNMEQVEVVKGPASAFAGRGSTGGTINLVSKAPSLVPAIGGSVNFGTDAVQRIALDINTPVAPLGERAAFRMNVVGHRSGIAGRDVTRNDRYGLAPSMSFGLGTPTRAVLSYFRIQQDNVPDYGIPWVPATNNALAEYRDQPAPVPRGNFYGLKSRDFERTGSDMGTFRLEHDFTDRFRIRNQLRYGRSTRDSVTTAPRFASNDSLVINRNGPSWLTRDNIWDNQTDLTLRVNTGSVQHDIATGTSFSREGNIRKSRTVTGTPTTTLYNPDPDTPFTGAITLSPIVGDLKSNSQAVYAFDTLKFSERWQVNGGVRWDRFSVSGVNTAGAPIARVDNMPNVRAAVVFKPAQNGTLYASYGTSMNPSLEGLSYQPADATLEPEKTFSVETGGKWDTIGGRLSLTAALFRVKKTNARTPGVSPDDPPQVLQGRQRASGVEFGASGRIGRAWTIFGGYTLLDSQILESNTPAEVGRRLINTPRHSFNLWSTRRFGRLEAGGGIRAVDKRYSNTTNTRKVDPYWTLDAMASYPVSRHLDLRLNLYNLNDAYYFDRLGGGHLVPGAARSALVSAAFRF